eukprot:5117757-Prymnesium_polylepis.1
MSRRCREVSRRCVAGVSRGCRAMSRACRAMTRACRAMAWGSSGFLVVPTHFSGNRFRPIGTIFLTVMRNVSHTTNNHYPDAAADEAASPPGTPGQVAAQ